MMLKRIQLIKINVMVQLLLVGGLVILMGGVTQAEPLFPEKPTAYLRVGNIHEIAYSPDGKLLAVAILVCGSTTQELLL